MARSESHAVRMHLRLYVAGRAPNSVRAIANATAICEAHFADAYKLEIVDLLDSPEQAAADGIIVTPTLLTLKPRPTERIIGNLSDTEQVLLALVNRPRRHD